jgi:hypothetical protein
VVIKEEYLIPVEVENQPRNIVQMKDFRSQLGEFNVIQSTCDEFARFRKYEEQTRLFKAKNLNKPADNNEIRCIPKVMQVSQSLKFFIKNLTQNSALTEVSMCNVYIGKTWSFLGMIDKPISIIVKII